MSGFVIYKAALVLFRPQADRKKTTFYNSGPPQDSSHFYKMPRDLPLRRASGCIFGDLSAVVASASRRPRASKCLVKSVVGQLVERLQHFNSAPVCHDSTFVHQVSYQRFLENRWIPDSLPTSPRPRRKPTLVDSAPTGENDRQRAGSTSPEGLCVPAAP